MNDSFFILMMPWFIFKNSFLRTSALRFFLSFMLNKLFPFLEHIRNGIVENCVFFQFQYKKYDIQFSMHFQYSYWYCKAPFVFTANKEKKKKIQNSRLHEFVWVYGNSIAFFVIYYYRFIIQDRNTWRITISNGNNRIYISFEVQLFEFTANIQKIFLLI